MDSFGSVIKEIRKNRKLTQQMLSEDICSQSVLSRIENDEELPNVVVMQQLCQRLGVTIDQIMHFKSKEVHFITEAFEKMSAYFRHKKFEQLYAYIKNSSLETKIYLDTEWQRYYYYLGSCEFYLFSHYEKALSYLQKGLSYTYLINKSNMSDIEIQLISCMGSTYSKLGKQKEAQEYLKLSIHAFHQLPNERINVELTKVFFNYSDFLVCQNRLEEAQIYADQGINWARKKNSYYYLSELFSLKEKILKKMGQEEQALHFSLLAQNIIQLETMSI